MHELDRLDRQILNLLQQDATLPLKTIAQQSHSSIATCQRRIQQLKDRGIINKQAILLNPKLVGYTISVFVSIEVESQNPARKDAFIRTMKQQHNVASCYDISGEQDYMLLVHAKDMEDYHHFTRRVLHTENNVRAFKSQFIINFDKADTRIML